MTQTIRKQSFELARKAIPGWVPVAASEKKPDPSWGENGRSFMIALREQKHAHLPFPDVTIHEGEEILHRALIFFWQGENNYIVKEMDKIKEFSRNPDHPTGNEIMQALLEGMAAQN